MKILLTGANGFVGSYMRELVPCIALSPEIDLRRPLNVQTAIKSVLPDVVIHLAGQTFVPRSFEYPIETYEINFLGTFNLLDALKRAKFRGIFFFVGSSDMYGVVPAEQLPISEDRALRPRSPYAVSKVAAEALCLQWAATEQFKIVMARPFNHIGPRQRQEFAIPSFAKQIIEIKKGLRAPVLYVGDVDITRDFTDVRDVVRAYEALLKNGTNGEIYNVCSGREMTIKDVIAKLVMISRVELTVTKDPTLIRLTEQRRHVGCFHKLHHATGWNPSIEIDQSLLDILDYWEEIVK